MAKMALKETDKDPYDIEKMRQKLKEDHEMFDNLLRLKEKLEMELPYMFMEDLDSSHFTSDVVFNEPHLPPIRGRENYKRFLRSLRDTGTLLFEDPSFDVVRATQHAEENLVKVRWRISGKYQGPIKFFRGSKDFGCFDGISYYYVSGTTGLVSVHQVDYQTPVMPPALKKQTSFSFSNAWVGRIALVPPVPAYLNEEEDDYNIID
jgi:hypothetical protein